jgi:hypothetical protein
MRRRNQLLGARTNLFGYGSAADHTRDLVDAAAGVQTIDVRHRSIPAHELLYPELR